MKEHEGEVMSSVEKSTVTVDSTAVDEILNERLDGGDGKTDEVLAGGDKGEDMMVDVVGVDAVDDDHGRAGANLDRKVGSDGLVEEHVEKETVTHDLVMEKFSCSGEDVCDASVRSRVLTFEKAEVTVGEENVKKRLEVSKDVLQGNVATMVASGSDVYAQKSVSWVQDGEPQVGGDIGEEPTEKQHVATVEEVADGDCVVDIKTMKEAEILDSAKIAESSITTAKLGSQEVDMVIMEEGFTSKIEAQDSALEDPSLVSPNNQSSSVEVVNSRTGEGDGKNKEESLYPTIEVITDDAQGNENVESLSREHQKSLINRAEESKRGLSEEVMEHPVECNRELVDGDHMVSVNIVKEHEALDSSTISEPLITAKTDTEDVHVVVVDEVLTSKDEAQNGVSVGPNTVSLDYDLDPQTEVDKLSKKESFHPTIEVIETDGKNSENGAGVRGSKLAVELMSGVPQFGGETDATFREETERGLTKNEESMEQPIESLQEVAYGDGEMDEKYGKGDNVSDSLKISESLTTAKNGDGKMNGFQVSTDAFEVVNDVTPSADVDKHRVPSEDSKFSYEDANMERGEDAGMDIDEVLGWKDEILGIDESGNAGCTDKDKHFKIDGNSEIGHREENLKPRPPIVYERRAHVEVPLYDALDGSQSPPSKDENLTVETDSEEDYESVQEEEQKVVKQLTAIDEVTGSSVSLRQSRYFQPPENEGEFSVSDLVWGKVRSHPWWPGQIIDPSDASEKAMKYHKKDCFLVAYFGDGTFAWNDPAVLKPFRADFSQTQKHANLESFKNAVTCALDEVSRRIELGLACSCVPQDIYEKIKYQVVENGGVRRKSMKRHGSDESASVSSFEPDKLVDYVRQLARFPGEGDGLDLVMATAQLSSYGRYKGYRQLPEFQFYGNILEDGPIQSEGVGHVNKNDKIAQKIENKERSLSDLTDDGPDSGDFDGPHITSKLIGSRKRKPRGSVSDGSVKRPNLRPDISTAIVSAPKPSFKVGECIRRVASQLTGTPKVDHGQGQHADQLESAVSLQIPEEGKQESVAEMLAQLHLTAQDPMKEYSFLNTIIPFFYERRAAFYSKSLKQNSSTGKPVSVRKRKAPNENDPEQFEFDDVNDSYWTDRIIQNHSEEQFSQDNQNGGLEYQVVAYEPDKPAKTRRRSNKKRFSSNTHEIEVKEEPEIVKWRRQNLATEVIMKFSEGIHFPSEIQINKMFRRFGPLMESESEVDRESGRARVVFKKCCDAEVAHSSAGKFNVFGSIDVNYELNYTPLVSYKPLPLPISQDPMDES